MLKLGTIFLVVFAWASAARATGGFSCEIDDSNLKFEAESALGTGMGGPILNLQAHAISKMLGTPNDLQELDLKTHLVHSWVDHPDFRLHFYMEREGETPHGTYELIMSTKASDEDGTYVGDYRLTIFYTEPPADQTTGAYLQAAGKVKCYLE